MFGFNSREEGLTIGSWESSRGLGLELDSGGLVGERSEE